MNLADLVCCYAHCCEPVSVAWREYFGYPFLIPICKISDEDAYSMLEFQTRSGRIFHEPENIFANGLRGDLREMNLTSSVEMDHFLVSLDYCPFMCSDCGINEIIEKRAIISSLRNRILSGVGICQMGAYTQSDAGKYLTAWDEFVKHPDLPKVIDDPITLMEQLREVRGNDDD